MEPLGQRLREARERLGLTLDEVERNTRIRTRHLEALERSDWEALPSLVQARGFLRNYAEFLGLDADTVLLEFAGVLQARRTRIRFADGPGTLATRSVQVRSRRPRWLSLDLFVAAGVTLAVLAVLVWGLGRVMAGLRQRTQQDLAASGFFLPTTEASLTPAPTAGTLTAPVEVGPLATDAGTATPTLPLFVGPANAINLRLIVEKRAYLRVSVDGAVKYDGREASGQALEFQGKEVVEVLTGNGGGVRAFFNGQDEGLLGELGQVVIRLWTLQGAETPTPTQTPTATVTPRVSSTPAATQVPPGG
jgi:transcriptional regulator with XRE-family HTH domain